MNLALFDFDGTISFNDSFASFLKYSVSAKKLYFGAFVLAPFIIAYKLKILSNQKAKEKVLNYFYNGMSESDFNEICQRFSAEILNNLCKQSALECLQNHKQNGDKIVIVSASLQNYLQPWCAKYGYDLLATKLEVKNGLITGFIDGWNCYGKQKVRKIKQNYDLDAFWRIYAYGDSKGDLPMLALAHERFYRNFK